ncbi:hypothetical protein [Pontibacter mangrovi]|uniref:Uncharacterized protein n=1 Tax=Pontibacter mangrovi TaxID=2589816 RepID=A0A501W910_9BACT|nr:hypothetical protein [Pontibacter mangrovi]TPE44860.1 hypothetical protein FJM65_07515 [Pontibacter mangrovi]
MNTKNIKSTLFALAAGTMISFGMVSCNTGTDPGDTNVDRGEIHDEGSMVGREEGEDYTKAKSEQDSMEQHYDHADHQNHDDNTGKVLGDGAYDGEGNGAERDDVQQ